MENESQKQLEPDVKTPRDLEIRELDNVVGGYVVVGGCPGWGGGRRGYGPPPRFAREQCPPPWYSRRAEYRSQWRGWSRW
jgi:hypothetical protein